MTIIEGNTKKGQTMLHAAVKNEGTFLWHIYDTYSKAKNNALEQCRQMCYKENGADFHICSHNTFGFSVAWEVKNGMRMETSKSSYLILFPECC